MNENPYLNLDLKRFPEGHPAREESMLTPLQSFAFPILMWFFDGRRHVGQGRTTLMAHVCIELAMRGEKVYVSDFSQWPLNGRTEPLRNYFKKILFDVISKNYKEHIFEYREMESILVYKGRRPR